jgi:ATP-dependent Clp protease ATP-binding subunit ClpA
MFERFTTSARDTVRVARDEAVTARRGAIGTEQILIGLLVADRGPAYRVLTAAGITADGVRSEATRLGPTGQSALGPTDAEALKAIGIDLDAVVAHVERTFGAGALDAVDTPVAGRRSLFRRGKRGPAGGSLGGPHLAPRSKKVLELSLREALHRGDDHIGAEHILLGLIREGDGLAVKILTDAGLSLHDLRDRLTDELGRAA